MWLWASDFFSPPITTKTYLCYHQRTQNPVPVFPRAPSLTGSLHVFMITFWGMGMTCIAIGHTSEADVEGCKG